METMSALLAGVALLGAAVFALRSYRMLSRLSDELVALKIEVQAARARADQLARIGSINPLHAEIVAAGYGCVLESSLLGLKKSKPPVRPKFDPTTRMVFKTSTNG